MMKRVAAGVIVLALTTLAISGCGIFDPQGTLTLKDVMNGKSDAVNTRTEVEETTDEACNDEVQCVEAYSTAEADYFRFPSRQQAEDFASSLDDGFVVNYFVMDFAGKNASVEHQLWAMQFLAGTWNDYEGSFPNRV
jgi:hypothetical protein